VLKVFKVFKVSRAYPERMGLMGLLELPVLLDLFGVMELVLPLMLSV
jgi:hypothetical protein